MGGRRGDRGAVLSTNYPDSVRFLYALGNEFRTIKLGLERVTVLLEALGSPHRKTRFIHVAGTNGKGSVCAMVESSLRSWGKKTGLYVSPHLVEPTERVQVCGEPVSREEFTWAFERVHGTAEALLADGRIDMHPTYFETVTSMAHLLFVKHGVEVAVLETGMGGRLDATNVVDPELAVITPVDFDHEKYLGDTIPKIAFEKAGIIKPGRPVAIARQRPEALAVLERRVLEAKAQDWHAAAWRPERLEVGPYGSRFVAAGPAEIPIECPLIGAHQVDNALTAVTALTALGVPSVYIQAGIAATRWPGRLERMRRDPDLFLDGAHNPAGAAALADYVREFRGKRRVRMVFGAMSDKDLSVIGPLLFPLADELVFTAPGQTRAFRPEELMQRSGENRAKLAATISEALRLVEDAGSDEVIFVTGSLYLVGEARAILMG